MINAVKKMGGCKMTPQRIAILDYLQGNTLHPSAEDIYTDLSPRFPTMSLSTVYNTLNLLREKHLLLELIPLGRRRRFDPNPDYHHHFICTVCEKIVDIPFKQGPPVPKALERDFEISGSRVQFYGICPRCRKQKKEER